MTSYLTKRITKAKEQSRIAVIPFITACFPSESRFWEILDELDASGADIIEIGIPFSDPVADGPVVQAASQKGLENGATLKGILKKLTERKGRYNAGIVFMGYYNPFLQYGLEKFARDAAAAGVHGCIVPDLPFEEAADFRKILHEHGLAFIPLVGVNTSIERMKHYAQNAEGFVYLVSNLGITGGKVSFPQRALDAIDRVRTTFTVPFAIGFGLKEPAQLEGLKHKPDAAVFGSAFLQHVEAGGEVAEFMKRWF